MQGPKKTGKLVAPGITKVDATTFIVRAQPTGPDGKKRQRVRTLTNATLQQAFVVKSELFAAVRAPDTAIMHQETVEDFCGFWLKHKAGRGDVEASTLGKYARSLGHLSPNILACVLARLTTGDVEAWLAACGADYAPASVNGWLAVLRNMLGDAQRLRGLRENAAAAARPLKARVDLVASDVPSQEDTRALLESLHAHKDYVAATALIVQALTGLRWGETSALCWDDVDLDGRVIMVRRKAQQGEVLPTTKTNRRRQVPVPVVVAELLKTYRARLVREQHPGLASGLAFPSTVSKPIANSRANKVLKAACRAVGVRSCATHDLRRGMNDRLREVEVSPAVAMSMIGHSTTRMHERYSTVSGDEQRKAVEAVAARVAGEGPLDGEARNVGAREGRLRAETRP
ncbi:MAG: tyrosine-type recombinase/integrase [Polyangiaceae bacterium]|nr:tyrosine-type recombinase/integrase [Polyangiaceae bacterium]